MAIQPWEVMSPPPGTLRASVGLHPLPTTTGTIQCRPPGPWGSWPQPTPGPPWPCRGPWGSPRGQTRTSAPLATTIIHPHLNLAKTSVNPYMLIVV